MSKFIVGDIVQWDSQARGRTTRKSGRIVRVLSNLDSPVKVASSEFPGHRRMFDGLKVPGNSTVAYLIEVLSKSGRGRKKLYMPYPKNLKVI